VHGRLGVAQKVFGAGVLFLADQDADADGDEDLALDQLERLLEPLADAVGDGVAAGLFKSRGKPRLLRCGGSAGY